MKIEIGGCLTVEFEMGLFYETDRYLPVHIFEKTQERYELLELNKSLIKAIHIFRGKRNIKTALLNIRRVTKLTYEILPGTVIVNREKGKLYI
jgi:hypothetical protein